MHNRLVQTGFGLYPETGLVFLVQTKGTVSSQDGNVIVVTHFYQISCFTFHLINSTYLEVTLEVLLYNEMTQKV